VVSSGLRTQTCDWEGDSWCHEGGNRLERWPKTSEYGGNTEIEIPIPDYVSSAPRVILTFFGLATLFALAYWLVPGLVEHLDEVEGVPELLRAVYFSVVTMTTLGFGDVVAGTNGIAGVIGHILLTIQVLLGYVMLAALVSRLAVLFQEG